MNYDYTASKEYCEYVGLIWLDNQLLRSADEAAAAAGLTQEQVDVVMRHHLWSVRMLFDPKSYRFIGRLGLALHFLFGKMKECDHKS